MSRPWESFTNQKQWKEYLQNLVRTNKRALYRSIILIAQFQTPEERALGETRDSNKVGFGTVDAQLLTSLAIRLENGGELTSRELAICRNKMPKYWRQLMIISKGKMKDDQSREEEKSKLGEGEGVPVRDLHTVDGDDHPNHFDSDSHGSEITSDCEVSQSHECSAGAATGELGPSLQTISKDSRESGADSE